MGNSQLGAINQFSKGEINYAHKLSIDINKSRIQPLTVRSIWIPNATLGEFKEIYLSIRKCQTEIDNLIFNPDYEREKIKLKAELHQRIKDAQQKI